MKNFIEVGSTEEEQVTHIKNWLSQNLIYIVAGITLGFGSLFSWNAYEDHQNTQSQQARGLYLMISQNDDIASNLTNIKQLSDNHADSIYLPQAKLLLAKHALAAKQNDLAIEQLTPLLNHNNKSVASLAKLSLAEVYIAKNDFDQAISTLKKQADSIELLNVDVAFDGVKQNLLGDIYSMQGNKKLAKEQYELAKKSPGITASDFVSIIDIKLNNLR